MCQRLIGRLRRWSCLGLTHDLNARRRGRQPRQALRRDRAVDDVSFERPAGHRARAARAQRRRQDDHGADADDADPADQRHRPGRRARRARRPRRAYAARWG